MMDAELKTLLDEYRWEGDVELERKRKVYLSFIVKETQDDIRARSMNLEENREMYEGLSRIIRRREARKRISGEFYRWSGVILPFVLGLLAANIWSGGNPPTPCIVDTQPLFDVRVNSYAPFFGTFFYDVSLAGDRFLINEIGSGAEPFLNVVVNWEGLFGGIR